MKKTRIVLAATGGVIALAVLTMACLTWLAFSERSEALGGDGGGGLEGAVVNVEKLLKKKPFPSEENRKRLDANREAVENWCVAVRKEIARGDWCAAAGATPALFKEQIGAEAKRMRECQRTIVKPDFAFGPFKDYLADKMPSAAQLPRLQRQWYDITSLIDVLMTNGVAQLVDLQLVDRTAAEAADKADAKSAKAKKTTKTMKKAKKETKEKREKKDGAVEPSVETYSLTFVARPAAFAGVMRTLCFRERFTVVESFGFARERDRIAEVLGGGDRKEKATGAGRSRRRRGASEEVAKAQEKSDDEKDGESRDIVFDPTTDSSVKVNLTVSVYDFRSLEDGEEEESAK